MDAKSIAQAYLELAVQKSSAWTHEMDLGAFSERFQSMLRKSMPSGYDPMGGNRFSEEIMLKQGDETVMSNERVNADFSRRVVMTTGEMPWIPSPQAGVERRMLDRIGGEVARATSLVRYAAASTFPAHEHALGEEFMVLSGVFSDEHGDYPAGTYVRNPPLSHHSPRTVPGCTIFVKLRQMTPSETSRLVIDTTTAMWRQGEQAGLATLPLFHAPGGGESVALERLDAGTREAEGNCPGGEEIFILSGDLRDGNGTYGPGTWIRNPAGFRRSLGSTGGTTYWVKRGHLRPMP